MGHCFSYNYDRLFNFLMLDIQSFIHYLTKSFVKKYMDI